MSKTLLDCVEIEPKQSADAAVIWLHGLGADGHDFEPIVPELGLPSDHRVRFIFPHAPKRPVTINQGFVMRAWYDIFDLEKRIRHDEAGFNDSEQLVRNLLDREREERGIAAERIVLAGFSQGGAMTLHTGLRYEHKLAGLLALSCYLAMHEKLPQERADANLDTPIFMAHGEFDPVLPMQLGQMSYQFLKQQGYDISWQQYPMPHSVSPREIDDVGTWLRRVLGY